VAVKVRVVVAAGAVLLGVTGIILAGEDSADDDVPPPVPEMAAVPNVIGMPGRAAQQAIANVFPLASVSIRDSISRDGCYAVTNTASTPLPEGWMDWPVGSMREHTGKPLLPRDEKIWVYLELDPGDALPCEPLDSVYGGGSGNIGNLPNVNLPNPDKPIICKRGPLKKFC